MVWRWPSATFFNNDSARRVRCCRRCTCSHLWDRTVCGLPAKHFGFRVMLRSLISVRPLDSFSDGYVKENEIQNLANCAWVGPRTWFSLFFVRIGPWSRVHERPQKHVSAPGANALSLQLLCLLYARAKPQLYPCQWTEFVQFYKKMVLSGTPQSLTNANRKSRKCTLRVQPLTDEFALCIRKTYTHNKYTESKNNTNLSDSVFGVCVWHIFLSVRLPESIEVQCRTYILNSILQCGAKHCLISLGTNEAIWQPQGDIAIYWFNCFNCFRHPISI